MKIVPFWVRGEEKCQSDVKIVKYHGEKSRG